MHLVIRAAIAVLALSVSGVVFAHPGHAGESFAASLAHPFHDLDHLLALMPGVLIPLGVLLAWRGASPRTCVSGVLAAVGAFLLFQQLPL